MPTPSDSSKARCAVRHILSPFRLDVPPRSSSLSGTCICSSAGRPQVSSFTNSLVDSFRKFLLRCKIPLISPKVISSSRLFVGDPPTSPFDYPVLSSLLSCPLISVGLFPPDVCDRSCRSSLSLHCDQSPSRFFAATGDTCHPRVLNPSRVSSEQHGAILPGYRWD